MNNQPPKKSAPDEQPWPYKQATVRGWNGNSLTIAFNKDKRCFDSDVVMLEIDGHQTYVSRDDLAEVLVNGYKATKEYREHLKKEADDLRKRREMIMNI